MNDAAFFTYAAALLLASPRPANDEHDLCGVPG